MKTLARFWLFAVLGLLVASAVGSLRGVEPAVKKVYPKHTNSTAGFGNLVLAATDAYFIIGDPNCSDDGPDIGTAPDSNSGAVHIYSTATGAYLRKLRAPSTAADDQFGTTLAVNGNKLLVSAPGIRRCFLFDITTGQLTHTLNPGILFNIGSFGVSLSLNSQVASIGSFDSTPASSLGWIALYSGINKPATAPLLPSSSFPGAGLFASNMAGTGEYVLIGSPGNNSNQGRSDLCSTVFTGQFTVFNILQHFTAPDGANGDQFGTSGAVHGRYALIGAPGDDANRGAAYLFDVFSAQPVTFSPATPVPGKLVAPDGVAGDDFGASVALKDHLALVGAPGKSSFTGAAYLFNARTGQFLRKFTAQDGSNNDFFGQQVSLASGKAIVASPGDDDVASNVGSVYLFDPVASPLPLQQVAATQALAIGATDTTFANFGEGAINDQAEVTFSTTLAGVGATNGKNRGIWHTLGGSLALSKQSGVSLAPQIPPPSPTGAIKASSFSGLIANQINFALYQAPLTGTGVNATNNRALFGQSGSSLTKLLRLGDAPLGPGSEVITQFSQVVQPMFINRLAMVARLKPGTGIITPVTATSDTGILALNNDGSVHTFIREGSIDPFLLVQFGQFSRVSFQHNDMIAAVPLAGGQIGVQSVLRFSTTFPFTFHIASSNSSAPDTSGTAMPGVQFGSFSGETSSFADEAVFRATLKGTGVTSNNNEGLWWEHDADGDSGSGYEPLLRMALREGQQVPGLPAGVVFNQFLQFWGMDVISGFSMIRGQILFLATLRGPGVNSSNDKVLCLLREHINLLSVQVLLREGDPAPNCPGVRIGTINRVCASPYFAQYAVLASLTGTSANRNLALFTGTTLPLQGFGFASEMWRPFLALRKGSLYEINASAVTVKSISIPSTDMDATGAGGKGYGLPINRFGEMILSITFSDGLKRLCVGQP